MRSCNAVLALLLLFVARTAFAELNIYGGVEDFRWREIGDTGTQLLEESGPRYRLGADWRLPLSASQRLLLQLNGSVYFGNIDYDGEACTVGGSCTPYKNDADYTGYTIEADLAQHFGADLSKQLFAGAGVDYWRRNIKGSAAVQGAIEDWMSLYAVAGAGLEWINSSVRYNARLGAKYPFSTFEYPDLYDVTLKPAGRVSPIARFNADFLSGSQPRWGFGAYYDSYHFAASSQERSGNVLVWQPESRARTIGFYASYYLH